MGCLSQEQLARLALGLSKDADLAAHLNDCAACQASLEPMQALTHQLTEAHARFNQGHAGARGRLLALLPAASRPLEPARPWNRLTHWLGELTMRERIALGGIGAAALLGLLVLWGGIVAEPVSAMEKMAEEIRKVKSYKCTVTIGSEPLSSTEPGKPVFTRKVTGTYYWVAPGSFRDDAGTGPQASAAPHQGVTAIIPYPSRRERIAIFHGSKTFALLAPDVDAKGARWAIHDLARFSGKADRELGTKEIEGKQTRGFEIDCKKLLAPEDAAEARIHGTCEIWIDTASNLPILIRIRDIHDGADHFLVAQLSDIQWNIDLDPKLFDPTPPAGYTDATPKPPASEEQVRPVIEALRTYAEASGGRYPPEKRVRTIETGYDLCKMLGVDALWPSKWPKKGDAGNAGKAAQAIEGFKKIVEIHSYNPDAAYHGKTVGPSDKDKVLLRWKLDDGRYEVIFGDLRSQTVTAERLRALERK